MDASAAEGIHTNSPRRRAALLRCISATTISVPDSAPGWTASLEDVRRTAALIPAGGLSDQLLKFAEPPHHFRQGTRRRAVFRRARHSGDLPGRIVMVDAEWT
jgi:hypothetical protein